MHTCGLFPQRQNPSMPIDTTKWCALKCPKVRLVGSPVGEIHVQKLGGPSQDHLRGPIWRLLVEPVDSMRFFHPLQWVSVAHLRGWSSRLSCDMGPFGVFFARVLLGDLLRGSLKVFLGRDPSGGSFGWGGCSFSGILHGAWSSEFIFWILLGVLHNVSHSPLGASSLLELKWCASISPPPPA